MFPAMNPMKPALLILALLASAAPALNGQSPSTTNQGAAPIEATTYTIKERGANHRVWERVEYQNTPSGEVVTNVHRYTELATGLHYWNTNANAWVESSEQILPDLSGASAVQGQHKLHFPYDIYQGVIEMITPEDTLLKSRPLCLSYFDGTKSVVIATLKASVGQLVSSNQVIYTDAFTNVQTGQILKADLVYTYKKGSFEQDIILRQQPPTPESYGLSSSSAR